MSRSLGLVLAGGGVKGMAHLGVMQALFEADIRPDAISGTSAGALVGAMVAVGLEPSEAFELFKSARLFEFSALTLLSPGFFQTEKLGAAIEPYLGDKTFEDLSFRLFAASTDLVRGECKIFQEGPVLSAVLASCAFPMIFTPVRIGDGLYSDGGIVNNFPVEPLEGRYDHVLGVYLSPLEHSSIDKLKSKTAILDRVYRISSRFNSKIKFSRCHQLIQPDEIHRYDTFEMGKMEEIYQLGYQEGKKHMAELQEALSSTTSPD